MYKIDKPNNKKKTILQKCEKRPFINQDGKESVYYKYSFLNAEHLSAYGPHGLKIGQAHNLIDPLDGFDRTLISRGPLWAHRKQGGWGYVAHIICIYTKMMQIF